MKKLFIILSLVTVLMLSTNAFAGNTHTDPAPQPPPPPGGEGFTQSTDNPIIQTEENSLIDEIEGILWVWIDEIVS